MRRGGKRRVVGRWAQQAHSKSSRFVILLGAELNGEREHQTSQHHDRLPEAHWGHEGGHRHGWSGPERVTPGLGFQIGFVALAKSGQDSAPEARGRRRDRKVLRSIGDTWPECQTEDKRTGAQRLGPAKISR